MGDITVGTCGYSYYDPPSGWKEEYEHKIAAFAAAFDLVEINRTFYSLPQVSTTERWHRLATEQNPDFTFTVKGWQALTHTIDSPTWRGNDEDLTEADREAVGDLQLNQTVLDAWTATRARATALDAPVVLLQTPPSFGCSDEHEENLRAFADAVDREGIEIAWEPRGDWPDHPERVRSICADCGLIHATDPFRWEPVATTDVAYLRLHGRNEDRTDYDYTYDAEELADLADTLEDLASDHEQVYCLFNNYDMYENASDLVGILDEGA